MTIVATPLTGGTGCLGEPAQQCTPQGCKWPLREWKRAFALDTPRDALRALGPPRLRRIYLVGEAAPMTEVSFGARMG